MNTKGWVRVVEASISIFIVLGFLFFLYSKTRALQVPDLSERARGILEEMAANQSMRGAILAENLQSVNNSIAQRIPESSLIFEVRICQIDDACGRSIYTQGDVYVAERVISTTIGDNRFEPKKVRLFIWRRS